MFKKIVFLGVMFCILPNMVIAGSTVSCDENYFLPANSTKKDDCLYCEPKSTMGHLYCPGGKFQKNFPFSQGIKYCTGKAGDGTCEDYVITLAPGTYLPAKSKTPVPCSGTNLTEAQNKIRNKLDDLKNNIKKALSVSSDPLVLAYYMNLQGLATADVGKLYCPGESVGYDWRYPSGIKVCNKKYVTGENNQTCTDTQPNNTASSSDQDAILCDSGYFLPKGAEDGNGYTYSKTQKKNVCTAKCNSKYARKDGYICTGGWYKVSQTEDMGLKKCANNQIVNERMTGCLDCVSGTRKSFAECTPLTADSAEITKLAGRKLSCNPGFYMMTKQEYIGRLQDNSSQSSLGNQTTKLEDVPYCMSCFDYGTNYSGLKCLGVQNKKLTDKEQGKEYCPSGQVTTRENPTTCIDKPTSSSSTSSSEQTTTESTSLTCPAGQVWVNGACVLCTSNPGWVNYAKENRVYCPGVTDTSKPILQQLNKCPKGMWPNATLTDCDCGFNLNKNTSNDGCVGTLSKDDMYYGPLGKSAPLFKQCWTKVSEKAYKKCMGFD